MKKITRIIAVMLLLCSCFWISSCVYVGNLFSNGESSTESSVETSENESSSEETDGDSSSEDSINGGNWTGEVPFHS